MPSRDLHDVNSQPEMDEDDDVYDDWSDCQSVNGCCCCCCRGRHESSRTDCVLDLDLHGVTRLARSSANETSPPPPLRRSVLNCHCFVDKNSPLRPRSWAFTVEFSPLLFPDPQVFSYRRKTEAMYRSCRTSQGEWPLTWMSRSRYFSTSNMSIMVQDRAILTIGD